VPQHIGHSDAEHDGEAMRTCRSRECAPPIVRWSTAAHDAGIQKRRAEELRGRQVRCFLESRRGEDEDDMALKGTPLDMVRSKKRESLNTLQ